MAYPFMRARGISVGKSLCSEEDVALAKKINSSLSAQKIVLPTDHVIASSPDSSEVRTVKEIPAEAMGLDIGPATLEEFSKHLPGAKRVFWNGPMGMFEREGFAAGTLAVAKAIAEREDVFSVVGGGDSVAALNGCQMGDKISHISTGGGASLKFLEEGTLPGISALG